MSTRTYRFLSGGFGRLLALAACLLCGLAHAGTPTKYYILSPETLGGALAAMSLEPGNSITVDSMPLATLNTFDAVTIPSTAFTSGSVIQGSGFFTLGSNQVAADLPVPADFAGTAFVVPQVAGSHSYFFLSPSGTATVTFHVGATTYTASAQPGVVSEYDAGSDNTVSTVITSDVPILVAHTAYLNGLPRDAFPVPPAATDVWGIQSRNAVIGALQDGTSVTVYASDGTTATYLLNAGGKVPVGVGSTAAQGQGSALYATANAPIAALQYDDGDGNDATSFWTSTGLGRRFGVPVDAQYVAIACNQPSVGITLYKGISAPETQTCSGSSTTPGKAYFGSSTSGANIVAGWYFISSSPVFAMYEAAATDGEHNTRGMLPAGAPGAPILNSIASPVSNNPQPVSGTAAANQTVRLYVNGKLQATTSASGSGTFSFNAILVDGSNTVFATTGSGTTESDPSNAVTVQYVNNIPRNQGGTVTGTVVWTPGSPAQPYTVNSTDLVVAAGGQLILQPGTQIQFGSGRTLTVNGVLTVNGTANSPVALTSSAASPSRGAWNGLVLTGTASGSSITNALVEWANVGVDINGTIGVTIANSTLRNSSSYGIQVRNGGNATITGNLITNVSGTSATGVYLNSTSATLQGNTISFFGFGVYLFGASNPTINQGNIISSNSYGVYIVGQGSATTQPNPVVNGNAILGNSSYNVLTTGYVNGATVRLNFQQNWWGSTAPAALGASINDFADSPSTNAYPIVDYSNFLNGLNGTPVTGNYLQGPLPPGATLTSGTTYDVLGALVLTSGQTLTIPAGVVLRFYDSNAQFLVNGTLNVQGTVANPAIFTSGIASPARGAWTGIVLNGSTANASSLSNALVQWATTAIDDNGSTGVTITNSTVRNFSSYGIQVRNGGNATIASNLITNLSGATATGVYLNATSATLTGNTISFLSIGVYLFAASNATLNQGNTITSNSYGVYIAGQGSATTQPNVVANGNSIQGNTNYNVFTTGYVNGPTVRLNFQQNWWGSVAPATIGAWIFDFTDSPASTTYPVVDYSSFLNGPNGTPVAGNYLQGQLPSGSTLAPGTTYDVLGSLIIASGQTLNVPAGAVLRFYDTNAQFQVNGTLNVQGTSTNPVTITSGNASPARGGWTGMILNGSAANGSSISNALIEWATTGVDVNGATGVTISNSTIRNFSSYGIQVRNGGSATIASNLITNLSGASATGVYLNGTSAALTGNTINFASIGVYLSGGSSPTITQLNTITSNAYGIYIQGQGSASTQPNPVITNNNIYGNTSYNVFASGYVNGPATRLNLQQNWWGATAPATIGAWIFDFTDSPNSTSYPVVDYSNFLNGVSGAVVTGNYLVGPVNSGTTLTSGTTYDVLGTLAVPAGQSLTIPAGVVLRFYESNAELLVNGTLTVQGTSANPVRFISGNASPARGAWTGIVLNGSAANGSSIDNALVEWASIAVDVNGATGVTISNSTLRNFSNYGIQVRNAGNATIASNLITNLSGASGYGVYLNATSSTLTGNTISYLTYGVYVYSASSPAINQGNVITNNNYGLILQGAGSATTQPNPVVNGNSIFGNSSYNVYTSGYANGATVRVNFQQNWWGAVVPTTIGAWIYDYTDSLGTNCPVVDYSNFLNGSNGTPVPGNYLLGALTSATTLTSGTTYDVLGTLAVASGQSLTIPAGVVLRFYESNAELLVNGTLNVQGTPANPVKFISGNAAAVRGAWTGIALSGSAANGSSISNALVEWATTAIDVNGATGVTISNSTLRNFSSYGIQVRNAGSATIAGNLITNVSGASGYGVYLNATSSTLTGNTINYLSYGVYLYSASTPTINQGNVITNNTYGLALQGANTATTQPTPVVNGNSILGNSSYNVYTVGYANGPAVRLNFQQNWWGSAAPPTIGAWIYDYTVGTSSSYPVVDYSNFLDGPNGNVVAGNYLIGSLSATTTLTAGSTYDVLGTLVVPAGVTLTVPGGVVMRFSRTNTRLMVDGTLAIQGTSSSRAILTSSLTEPTRGSWYGIEIHSTAANVVINYALIDWANTAISVSGTNATISNSWVRYFSNAAIQMTNATSASQISGNYIDNFGQGGYGIYLSGSSPVVSANQVSGTSYGIYLQGPSNPNITGNTLANNSYGLYLYGAGSNTAAAVPNPVVTGNDIFGNGSAQIVIVSYGASNPVVINATGNWWGTPTPQAGQQIVFSGSPMTAANFTSPASAPVTGATAGSITVSQLYISPNGDGILDTTTISGNISRSAAWTVTVRDSSGSATRTYSGSGTAVSAVWDGKNGSGQVVADGPYAIELNVSGSANPSGGARVTVDTTPPTVVISSPATGTVLTNSLIVPVVGTTGDTHLVNYILEYGAGTNPTSWTTISSQSSAVTQSTLGNWVVNSTNGSTALPNGPYVVRLRASDLAGNNASTTIAVTLDNLSMTSVSPSSNVFQPVNGGSVQVNFTLGAPATAYLRIYSDLTGALVREISQNFTTGGAQSLSWDGKDASGAFLPDEAYDYVLYATDGTRTATYDIPAPADGTGSNSGTVPVSFNPYRNVFWKMTDYNTLGGRVRATVSGCVPAPTPILRNVVLPAGTSTLVWDGRDANGQLVSGSCSFAFDTPLPIKPNAIFVRGNAPVITGTGAAPNVEVQSTPWMITHSYEQVARITYRVNQDSYVTVKLLPPGIADPSSSQAIILVNNELDAALNGSQPADHTIEWRGYDPSHTNSILVSSEGAYTFAIQATSVQTGQQSLYRGVLQLYQ